MTKSIRGYAASLLACLGLSLPAAATTFSTDYTDLWLVPSEAGWGLNLIHQGNTLFASMFVYGTDNQPRWYFASSLTGSATSFSGGLFRSTGPAFSAPWNAAQYSGAISVGTMTLNFATQSTGTLTYTVDGASVTKNISRFAFKLNNLAGNYIGGMTAVTNSCVNPVNNGGLALLAGFLDVTHGSGNPTFIVEYTVATGATAGQTARCTFTGAYIQEGKLGNIPNGTWSCVGGASNSGTFSMAQIDAKIAGFNAVITARDAACSYVGYFGGVADVP